MQASIAQLKVEGESAVRKMASSLKDHAKEAGQLNDDLMKSQQMLMYVVQREKQFFDWQM